MFFNNVTKVIKNMKIRNKPLIYFGKKIGKSTYSKNRYFYAFLVFEIPVALHHN